MIQIRQQSSPIIHKFVEIISKYYTGFKHLLSSLSKLFSFTRERNMAKVKPNDYSDTLWTNHRTTSMSILLKTHQVLRYVTGKTV